MKDRIKSVIISENTRIIDAMKTINEGEISTAFVCSDNKLVAAVSDGDVRRYIIGGGDINAPISVVANYNPIFVQEGTDCNYSVLMKEQSINALPIVNSEKEVVDIITLKSKVIKKSNIGIPVVIMAGGKGTRLKPYTDILPKPLIPVGQKTITEHIINRFEQYGCNRFDMIVNYKKNFIKSYFQDNDNNYNISFMEEPEFWGTAGGLKLVEGKYDGTIFVTNCDIIIEADYKPIYEYHKKNENIITVVCARKKIVIPYGTVETDENGKINTLVEKPTFNLNTNTGLYLIEPRFIEMIKPNTKVDITDMITYCIENGESVGAYIIDEEDWLDMGQLEELERMKKHLSVD